MAGSSIKGSKRVGGRKAVARHTAQRANGVFGARAAGKPTAAAQHPGGRRTAKRDLAQSVPTEPTADDIAAREAVAQAFFNPVTAAAARAAYLKRQQSKSRHAG